MQVIFGTGPAGRATMYALLQQGHKVRVVNRSGGIFPQGVEVMTGDVRDPSFVREAITGTSVAYQTLNAPYHRWAQAFPPLQQGLLDGMRGTGVRLVALENLYVYGDTKGQPMSSSTPLEPDTRKGKVRAQMARELQDAHQAGDIEVVQVRASDFIGPEVKDSSLGQHLIQALLTGKALRLMGDPDQPHSMTYMPDLGHTLAMLGQQEEAVGKVWHAPCPPIITPREYLNRLAAELAVVPQYASTPTWLLHILGVFNPMLREIPEMLYQWNQPFRVEYSAVETAFGLKASPWSEIIPATLAWWQGHLTPSSPHA